VFTSGQGMPIGPRNLEGTFSPQFTSHTDISGDPHTFNTSTIYSRPYTHVRLSIFRPTGERPWGAEGLYVESDSGLNIRTFWQREVSTHP